jgi:hypothetical protein
VRAEVRTTLATMLLAPPATLWGIGTFVRDEWCVRAVMGVTSIVCIVTWVALLTGRPRQPRQRTLMVAVAVITNIICWHARWYGVEPIVD